MIERRFDRDAADMFERAPAIIELIETNTDPAVWAGLSAAQKDEALRRALLILAKLLRLSLHWTN